MTLRSFTAFITSASAVCVLVTGALAAPTNVALTNTALVGTSGNSSTPQLADLQPDWMFLETNTDGTNEIIGGPDMTGDTPDDSLSFNPHDAGAGPTGTHELFWEEFSDVIPPNETFGFHQHLNTAMDTALGGPGLIDGNQYEIVVSMWVHDKGTGTATDNDDWRETSGNNDVGKAESNLGIGLANTTSISSTTDFGTGQSFWYPLTSKNSFLPNVATDEWREWSRTYSVTHSASNDYYFFIGGTVANGAGGQRVTLPSVTIEDLTAASAVPEPSAVALCFLGVFMFMGRTWRRQR